MKWSQGRKKRWSRRVGFRSQREVAFKQEARSKMQDARWTGKMAHDIYVGLIARKAQASSRSQA